MKKNLNQKILLIVGVLLVFLFGIFRIPDGISGKAWLAAVEKQIHLGLDLQGGVHLIMQVQVEEAVSDETDNAAARVRDALKTGNVTYSQVIKPDPNKPELIELDGTPAAKASDVRSVLDQKFSNEYDISAGSTDTSWTLTMKPLIEKDLEQKTVTQAIETIRDRVDAFGVSEPQIAPYSLGQNQILVELPGISDLDAVNRGAKVFGAGMFTCPAPEEFALPCRRPVFKKRFSASAMLAKRRQSWRQKVPLSIIVSIGVLRHTHPGHRGLVLWSFANRPEPKAELCQDRHEKALPRARERLEIVDLASLGRRASVRRASVAEPYAWNELPQPQVDFTWGLLNLKPEPSSVST